MESMRQNLACCISRNSQTQYKLNSANHVADIGGGAFPGRHRTRRTGPYLSAKARSQPATQGAGVNANHAYTGYLLLGMLQTRRHSSHNQLLHQASAPVGEGDRALLHKSLDQHGDNCGSRPHRPGLHHDRHFAELFAAAYWHRPQSTQRNWCANAGAI